MDRAHGQAEARGVVTICAKRQRQIVDFRGERIVVEIEPYEVDRVKLVFPECVLLVRPDDIVNVVEDIERLISALLL